MDIPCQAVTGNGVLHYDKGIMTFTDYTTIADGDVDTSTEEGQVGSFSFDFDQDILCWYNGPDDDFDSVPFVRSQNPEDNPDWEEYDEYFEEKADYATELNNADLIRINDPISVQLAHEWRNAYNKSLPQALRIANIHVRNIYPAIKKNGTIAVVVTEVEFWMNGKGGSSSGSVYTVVAIDVYSGDVLSAGITA